MILWNQHRIFCTYWNHLIENDLHFIGSCQKYLGLTDEDIEYQHKSGHVCGDNVDIIGKRLKKIVQILLWHEYINSFIYIFIDGKPTGSIRISFGHYSTIKDANFVIQLIKDYFRTDAKSCGKYSLYF